jgi:hypothetical protein
VIGPASVGGDKVDPRPDTGQASDQASDIERVAKQFVGGQQSESLQYQPHPVCQQHRSEAQLRISSLQPGAGGGTDKAADSNRSKQQDKHPADWTEGSNDC